MPVEHFRSKLAEMKNLAYRHLHNIPYTATTACVAGKCHKVKHSKLSERKLGKGKRKGKSREHKTRARKGA